MIFNKIHEIENQLINKEKCPDVYTSDSFSDNWFQMEILVSKASKGNMWSVQKKNKKKNTMTLSFLFASSVSPCPSFFLWTVPSNLKAGILIINLNDCFPHWHSNLFYLTTMFKTQINLTPFSWMTRWLSLSKRSLRCRSNTLKTFKNCWTKQIRDCKKWRQNTTNRTVLL